MKGNRVKYRNTHGKPCSGAGAKNHSIKKLGYSVIRPDPYQKRETRV